MKISGGMKISVGIRLSGRNESENVAEDIIDREQTTVPVNVQFPIGH